MQQISRILFKIGKDKLRFLILSYLILSCLILSYAFVQAQPTDSLRLRLNQVFQRIDKTQISTGYLAEYGIPFINLAGFNGQINSPVTKCNMQSLRMGYESWRTSYTLGNSPAISLDNFNNNVENVLATNVVPIPIIYAKYAKVKQEAFQQNLLRYGFDSQGKMLVEDVPYRWTTPYEEKEFFMVAPAREYSPNGRVTFIFKPEMLLGNVAINFNTTWLYVDFGDGRQYRNYNWNESIQVQYSTSGKKTIKVNLYGNGISGMRYTEFNFDVQSVTTNSARFEDNRPIFAQNISARPFPGSIAHSGCRISFQYSVSNTTGRFRKPLIIVEGFDPSIHFPDRMQNFNMRDFIRLLNPNNLGGDASNTHDFNEQLDDALGNNAYDLIFVDFNNGTDDIKRNARCLQDVLAWVNNPNNRTGNQQNVVIGVSMGGLIARYGLAQMIREGINPQTRLLITHDSPHRGANVPLGFQFLAGVLTKKPLGIYAWQRFAPQVKQLESLYEATGTQQLLMNRLSFSVNPITGQFNTQIIANTFLNSEYRSMIDNLTTPYQVIATSLGSECGVRSAEPYRELVRAEGSFFLAPNTLITSNNNWLTEIRVNALPHRENKQIAWLKVYADYYLFGIIRIRETLIRESYDSPANLPALDGTGGGIYNVENIIGDNIPLGTPTNFGVNFMGITLPVGNYTVRSLAPNFCFIPTPSALDVATIDDASLSDKYINNTSIGGSGSRFLRFIAQEQFTRDNTTLNNESHPIFTHRNSRWMLNEMENRPNSIACSRTCTPPDINIAASLIICEPNSTETEFFIPNITSTTYTWTTNNSNLQIISGQGTNRVRVRRTGTTCVGCTISVTYNSGCGATTITTSTNGGGGFSSSDYPVTGPSEAVCGTRVYYSAPNLPGATNYEWIYPSSWTYVEGQGTRFLTLTAGSSTGSVGVRVANSCDAGGSPAFKTTYISCEPGGGGCSSYLAYPNPASDQLLIQSVVSPCGSTTLSTNVDNSAKSNYEAIEKGEFTINLLNSIGKLVKTGRSIKGEMSLDVSNLPDGFYILQIIKKGKLIESKKIIIQKNIIPN
jgi:pimeloyl-ACP methyl ester carboxylesterase